MMKKSKTGEQIDFSQVVARHIDRTLASLHSMNDQNFPYDVVNTRLYSDTKGLEACLGFFLDKGYFERRDKWFSGFTSSSPPLKLRTFEEEDAAKAQYDARKFDVLMFWLMHLINIAHKNGVLNLSTTKKTDDDLEEIPEEEEKAGA